MAKTTVFAFGCHPDDIEFMMAGTLFQLKKAGCEIHYMNLANGNCGSTQYKADELARIRRKEAMGAAAFLGAGYHESLVGDLEVFYKQKIIRKVTAVIREIAPDIMLIPSIPDYMEDHMNTARIGVTAAFCKGMPNYKTIPDTEPIQKDVMLYHALPYGLTDGLRNKIYPHAYVDITDVIDDKEKMLSFHKSQQVWLDESQGRNSYLEDMRKMSAEVGSMSGSFKFAEGWRRHSYLGYSGTDTDPLAEVLRGLYRKA
jgi:LmbE family N-acetylglucosaminyl deacetylase